MSIAVRELRTDDHDGAATGERSPAELEQIGRAMHPPPRRTPAADIGGKILSDAEDHRPAPQQADQRQRDRMRLGSEHPHAVVLVERAPELVD